MTYSTYYLKIGDVVNCMRCNRKITLDYEPVKCCIDKQDAAINQCGCQGTPEPIFCEQCWDEIAKDEFQS